jgi:hypothetical protein
MLIDAHDENACPKGAQRADHCLEDSDHGGMNAWKRVERPVDELQRQCPGVADAVN